MRVLFVASEAVPLVKTGGLGDVAGALPPALRRLRQDVRLLLPAYPEARARAGRLRPAARLTLPPLGEAVLLAGRLPGTSVPLWLLDAPAFRREGHPYTAPGGHDWPDNPQRFALLARAAAEIALDRCGLGWRADVLHAHDWQTALAPALLAAERDRPATVFTIHNLAYRGIYGREVFDALGLPAAWWHPEALEFWGAMAFIKGGLAFADRITTVSPTYAREIRTPTHGEGLDGLLRARSERLHGILNGVDYALWDPRHDPHLPCRYGPGRLQGKAACKAALQAELGLEPDPAAPLVVHVGRLVAQKGVDLLVDAAAALWPRRRFQLAVLGTGDPALERAVRDAAAAHPGRMAARIGYDEALAHRMEAGADLFAMPSRFEPCGLSQLYSLRYGTLPVVRRTGGLADTVIDALPHHLRAGLATGFVFDQAEPWALAEALGRALDLYRDRRAWRRLQDTGMGLDFGWPESARQYLAVYRAAVADRDAAVLT
ncbi:glycogen synthase GlgA [Inmirania thermothiophila]|uniref:Glycogen synthase n=1 Tax=Inmirania thermothiophila TaxID=1750597 RepID=A0A3N1Y5H7_9GAMM|nr:glycogen synthase GlgA [Inmirania thermothiophila]ROR32872.1 starch synthase [Inmirania thermothiophila]